MSVRTDVVNLLVNVGGDKAKDELNQLRKKAADLSAEMKGLNKNTAEYKAKAAELKTVEGNMANLRKQIGLTALSQKELTAELRRLQQLKNIATPQTQEFKDLQKQIEAVQKRLYDVKNGVFGFQSTLSKIGKEVKQFGLLAAGYLGFEFITDNFKRIISGAGQLSDQLADLQRVAGLTADEAQTLNQGLRAIDTRTSGEGLRNIAIIAGKLGVAKGDILEFTKAVDMLVVSLGDELGDADQITTQLGKILNVFDGSVNGSNISTLGNAIVELANAGVASGGFITDFAQRISGIAKASNLSLGATVGLAAGFEELGLRSESSATALQKLLSTIAGDLPKAAQIAGMPLGEFNKLFSEKPQEALIRYAQGLVKNKASFAQITASFKDAGEEGARVVQTLQAIGQRGEFLETKIALAGDAIKDTTAITNAYALKNETLGATLDKIGKRINALFSSSGLVNIIKSATQVFADLIGAVAGADTALGKFKVQADKVNKLEKDIMPLLERYDTLKSKTTLSKDEQVELNKAINSIASSLPAAVTEFDKYGRALGINTEKAREFVRVQQLILKEKNRDAIAENEAQLKRLEAQQKEDAAKLNRAKNLLDAAGNKDDMKNMIPSYERAIKEYQLSLAQIQDRMTGIKGILSELRGEDVAKQVNDAVNKPGTVPDPVPGVPPADDKALDKLRDLKDKILALRAELEAAQKGEDAVEIERVHQKYATLIKEAMGYSAQILELRKLESDEVRQLEEKQGKKHMQQGQDAVDDFFKSLEAQAKKYVEAAQKAKAEGIQHSLDLVNKEVAQMKEAGEQRIKDAEKVQQRLQELERRGFEEFLGNIDRLLSLSAQAADARDNSELAKYLDVNEKKKKSFDDLLKAKRISQRDHDRQIEELDKQAAQRKYEIDLKQFRRHQAMAYTQAIINAAEGITKIWATYAAVPYVAAALTGIEAIATGLEIATIAKQQPPKARKGLVVQGSSHEQGGIDMIDQSTGRAVANIEGGEPVMVLSRNTYSNNKPLIDQLLYNSNYRNGAPVMPSWVSSTPTINPGILPAMQRGGVYSPSPSTSNTTGNLESLMGQMLGRFDQMASAWASLPGSIRAHVVLQDVHQAQDMMNTIRRESGLQQSKNS